MRLPVRCCHTDLDQPLLAALHDYVGACHPVNRQFAWDMHSIRDPSKTEDLPTNSLSKASAIKPLIGLPISWL